MPSCRVDVIPPVLQRLMELKPTKILDVGIGHGKWGVLCDEYLRIWCGIAPTIDGVEPFEPYRNVAYAVYNEVFKVNVLELLDAGKLNDYDLVLMVDVIEHIEKEDGLRLLDGCRSYLVSTPGYWNPQGVEFDNELERHVSMWSVEDFANSTVITGSNGAKHIIGWKS